jgi:heme-degrading monooxygenase HmoA
MIARLWHGATPSGRSEEYLRYLHETGLPGYQNVPGNQGVQILTRVEGAATHFLVISYWDSREAVARFAGEPVERAQYYPRDREFLLELEPKVVHYQVAATQ